MSLPAQRAAALSNSNWYLDYLLVVRHEPHCFAFKCGELPVLHLGRVRQMFRDMLGIRLLLDFAGSIAKHLGRSVFVLVCFLVERLRTIGICSARDDRNLGQILC